MSVRNFQAKNYTKVAPFPRSSNLIPNRRPTPQKYDTFLATNPDTKCRTDTNRPEVRNRNRADDVANAIKKPKLNSTKRTDSLLATSPNVTLQQTSYGRVPGNANAYLNNNRIKTTEQAQVRKVNLEIHSKFQRLDRSNLLQDVVRKHSGPNGHVIPQNAPRPITPKHASRQTTPKTTMHQKTPKASNVRRSTSYGDINDSGRVTERPKSARPDSRMMRHRSVSDDVTPMDTRHVNNRPKSARPDSRMTICDDQHYEQDSARNQSLMYTTQNDPPPRPKTSHGHRRQSDSGKSNRTVSTINANQNNEYSGIGRPTSRRERTHGDVSPFSDDSAVTYLYTDPSYSNTEGNRYKNVSDGDESFDSERDTEMYEYDFRNDTNSTDMRNISKTRSLSDLHNRLGDIDLDMDPVEFFYREDEFTVTNTHNAPTASTNNSANINTVSSSPSKPASRYYGNPANNQDIFTDNSVRYHSNRDFSQQVSEHERSNTISTRTKRDRVRSDSLITANRKDSSAFEDIHHSRDSLARFSKSYKSPMHDEALSKYRNANMESIMKRQKFYSNETMAQPGTVQVRKPRKLAPINVASLNKKQY